MRLVDRRWVVNPGSVGMPYGRPGGSWALLRGGQVSLRHTAIDVDAAVAAVVAGSGYPGVAEWADVYPRPGRVTPTRSPRSRPRDARAGR